MIVSEPALRYTILDNHQLTAHLEDTTMHNTRFIWRVCLAIALILGAVFLLPTPTQAIGTCTLTAGQVVINEILPAATSGMDWVELYNTTNSSLDLGSCYIDDIAGGGGSPIQIPAGTTIAPHGFWTLDRSSYFNNGGDDVRLLLDDVTTVLDSYTYGSTAYDASWFRLLDGGSWQVTATTSPTKGATNGGVGTCGTGSWTPGTLEIHHMNIGQGSSSLIVGPTGKSLLLDAGETYWNSSTDAQKIGPYIESVLGCKQLDYVIITHFHSDHIGYVGYGGLWNLVEVQGFTVGQTLLRDYNTYMGTTSGTFTNWKTYLEGAGQTKLHPVTAVEGTGQVNLGPGMAFDIVTVDGNSAIRPGDFSADALPPSENDYSIGAVLRYGNFDEWLGGDLDGQFYTSEFSYNYHDIELSVAPEVGDVDVYLVNHHGSDHSNSPTFVNQLDPEVAVISVGNDNGYGHPRQSVMDTLLATSDVYLTERGDPTTNIGNAVVAGDVVIKTTDGSTYTVNGTAYTATEPTRTDADGDGYFAEVDPSDSNPFQKPAPNGGCDAPYQYCTGCPVTAGQVVINEIAPSISSGLDWIELYNTTSSGLNVGYCILDDIANGGGSPYQIPANTVIPANGYWTLDLGDYFNNTGDDVRFLKDDAVTVLDSYTYGSTGSNLAWYRSPSGGIWQPAASSILTKGNSNPVTTAYLSPASQAAAAGGDGNGFQTNPANAFTDNAVFAVDTDSGTNTSTSCTDAGKDKHDFYGYGFSLPAGATVDGLEIQLQAKVDSTSASPKMCVQLSSDGGVTWTTAKSTSVLSTTEKTYLLGGLADLWGRAWQPGELANLRIRVINIASSAARDFSLDWLSIRAMYH
jgi:beta-lactamase superfamily II metal-dependent hydrolase